MSKSNGVARGPDRILPADGLRTSNRDGAVRIRLDDGWPADEKPVSVPTYFKQQCESAASLPALCVKRDGAWQRWTFADYMRDVRRAAKAFISFGLEARSAVAVSGFNSPEWAIAELAAIHAGAMCTGLYPTNGDETNCFVMDDSRTNVAVVEDAKTAKAILSYRDRLPELRKIVQWSGAPVDHPDVVGWEEALRSADSQPDDELERRLADIAINQCCLLIYTSGTTGNPKGVMLSHDNVIWTSKMGCHDIGLRKSEEILISFLPLSHVAANVFDVWLPIVTTSPVHFADRSALKGTLLATLQEVRPTLFLAVPRVYEKIMEGMLDKGKSVRGLKRKIADACKAAGLRHHLDHKDGLMYSLGKKAVYGKVRAALGLDRCRVFLSGAAPITMETLKYFLSLDIVIDQGYGMSETTTGHHTTNGKNSPLGSVGAPVTGVFTRLRNADADTGAGEVCMWGRNIMMGYLNREDKTTEDLQADGWLHSGDVGTLDERQNLRITGRIKELLITAGGENVAPVPIEEAIRRELPCLANAIVVGDRRRFLSALLTLHCTVDADGAPTRTLTPAAVDWCRALGSEATCVDDVLRGPDARVMAAIQQGIDRANRCAVSNATCVRKWSVLPDDVSIAGGELGPTMKLKRFYVDKKHAPVIERIYA